MSLVVDEHRQYLADAVRVEAFRRAVERVVQPGAVVVDLGAGTGILGLLACRAGARRVYSIEAGGMIELAREIARANGFEDRIVFVKGLSTQVDLPEKADVLIADQIGRFGFEAGLLECFADARQRFLRAGGSLIPRQVQLCVAPVERPDLADQVEFWGHSPAGFDFQPARELAVNTGYPVTLRRRELLAPAVGATDIDLATASPGSLRLAASFEAARSGTLHGIGGWFVAQLAPGVSMTNSPLAARRIHRRNVFFPVDQPVAVAEGDPIHVTLHIRPEDMVVAWKVEVWKAGADGVGARCPTKRAEFRHSTLRGMLIAQEDLRRTEPGMVPRLVPRGEARRTVLELCDGRRPLAQIEREVQRRHPALFASAGEAAEFVAEVVTRYAT